MGSCEFALNADDPLIADLGRDRELRRRPGVTYFGIEDESQALPELQHAHDAKHCRRCGAPYVYDRAFVGHLGHYTCPNCDADRPAPDVAATEIELHGISGSRVHVTTPEGELDLELPLPGLYNVYNALAAIAAGLRSGVSLERVRQGLESMRAVFGRVETIEVAGKPVSILLIKNPAGANEVLRTLQPRVAERRHRPLARAQRPDRRRPRRLLDLGRRLRAARGRRPPGGLRRDPGAGDGAASQVRGLAPGLDRGDRADRATRSTRRSLPRPSDSSPCPPTPPCSSCARCSRTAGSRRTTGNERTARHPPPRAGGDGDLAAGRVRLLRGRPPPLGRAGRGGGRPSARARRGRGPGQPAPRRRRPERDRAGAGPRARSPARGIAPARRGLSLSAVIADLGSPADVRLPREPALAIGAASLHPGARRRRPGLRSSAGSPSSWRPGGTIALDPGRRDDPAERWGRLDADPPRHAGARRLGLLERAAMGAGRR